MKGRVGLHYGLSEELDFEPGMFLQSRARGLSLYTSETSASGCGLTREASVNLGLDYSLEGLTAGLCQLAVLPAAQCFTSEEESG